MNPTLTKEQRTKIIISCSTGQYELLYNLMCDAYDRGYDQRPKIDTQTFDNLFDSICNAKETYLA